MRMCAKCKLEMNEKTAVLKDGVSYKHYQCPKCRDEFLDMKQLHDVAEKYRNLKRMHAKVSKWGTSLGIRIPKDLVKKYGLKSNTDVMLIPDEDGIKIISE